MPYKFNPFTGNLDIEGPIITGTGTVSAAADGTAQVPGINFASDLNTGIYRPGNDQLAISTGGTGRLFIDSNGNIGVGTSSPENYGSGYVTVEARGTSGSAGGLFQTQTYNASVKSYYYCDSATNTARIGTVTSHPFLFVTDTTERMRIDSSGLDVSGNAVFGSGATRLLTYSDSTYSGIYNGSTVTSDESIYMGAGVTFFYNNGSERMRIDSSGRVGIGTSSPTERLQVTDGTYSNFYIAPGYNDDAGTLLGVGGAEYLSFATNGLANEAMRITSSGNVGIGTSSPGSKLHVSSTAGVEALVSGGGTSGDTVLHLKGNGNAFKFIVPNAASQYGMGIYDVSNSTYRMWIDSVGRLLVGTTTGSYTSEIASDNEANFAVRTYNNSGSNFAGVRLFKSRGSKAAPTIVAQNDRLSDIIAYGYDGTTWRSASSIRTQVDATPGSGDMPGRLVFSTTADGAVTPTERMRIDSSGAVTISTGDLTVNSLTVGRGAGNVSTNTAVGGDALNSNTTGHSNTANGFEALRSNTTGSGNTANGYQALRSNTTGIGNTANGRDALYNNTTGSNNTANGQGALYSNTTGIGNTANGRLALYSNTTGSGNFGAAFRNSGGTYAPVFDPTTENNRVVMGHTSVTNAYVQVAWTVVSDARDKMNFAPVPHGLDFINQLQPTAYQFKVDRDTEEPNGPVRYGFKAQDILALEGEDNAVIIDNENPDKLRYNGEALVPVLVNAIKEQQSIIETQQEQINNLLARLDAANI